jgi:hypothetical protein
MATSKSRPWNKETKESAPSGGWGSLPANLRPLADLPGELTPHKMGDISVLVSAQTADLADLTTRVFDELQAKLIAAGGGMTVTEEELLRYFATAIYSRTMWVNKTMREGAFRPNDKWALPVAMHMVVSAIGIVETNAGIRYVPEWVAPTTAPGESPLILTRQEWESFTRRLLALEPFGLRFVKAYEMSDAGVEKVMSLLRVDEEAETFFYAWVPPHALEALIAAVLGISRSRPVDVSNVPLDFIPTYRIRGSWVLRFMHDFARMNEHRDVA